MGLALRKTDITDSTDNEEVLYTIPNLGDVQTKLLNAFTEANATNQETLKTEILLSESRLKASIKESEHRLQLGTEKLRAETQKSNSDLLCEIERLRAEARESDNNLQSEIEKSRAEAQKSDSDLQLEIQKLGAETQKV